MTKQTCVRHTELPHTSRLFSDFLYRYERVSRYYDHGGNDLAALRAAAASMEFPPERRAALVAALREQNGEHPALEQLARPGTVAVVTGQQVGLFSGPCYTIYKALTAVRLAGRLREVGVSAVPVFWLATEDHDFAEVNHCWVFDATQQPVRLEIPGNNAAHQPVGEIRIEASPVEALREALRGLPYAEEVTAMAAEAYAPGETFGSAFHSLLKRLLASQGLLYLDPMQPAARSLAAPLLAEAVRAAADMKARVLERNRELEAAGYHAQVHVEEQTSFFFLLENGRRLTLRRQDGEYASEGGRISVAELAGRAERLSPNALLRPVVQDYMLPTVAYIGGPAELAYLAQAEVIYRLLLGRMPVPLHRYSTTLLDARAAKLMERYRLGLKDFFHGEEALRERIAARLVPPDLQAVLDETRQEAAGVFDRLGASLERFDVTLGEAFARSRRKMEHQLAKTGRKAGRVALARNERAAAEAAYLANLIYPQKHLQERFYSMLPFLARHGPDLVARLARDLPLDCPDHQVTVV